SFRPTATLSPRPVPCTPHQTPARHAMAIDHVHARATGVTDLRDHALRLMKRCKGYCMFAGGGLASGIRSWMRWRWLRCDGSIPPSSTCTNMVPSSPITAAIVVFLIKPGGSKIIIHLFFNDLPLPTSGGSVAFCYNQK